MTAASTSSTSTPISLTRAVVGTRTRRAGGRRSFGLLTGCQWIGLIRVSTKLCRRVSSFGQTRRMHPDLDPAAALREHLHRPAGATRHAAEDQLMVVTFRTLDLKQPDDLNTQIGRAHV